MHKWALNLGNKIVNTQKLRQRGAPVTNNEKGTRQINSPCQNSLE